MQGATIQKLRTPEDPMSTVRYCLRVLRKHSHAVFFFSLLLASAGIAGISLIPSKYKATTTILVDPQKIPERYVASTVTTDMNAHLSTLTQQVLSATRLQQIIDQEHLYTDLRGRKSRDQLLDYMRAKIKIDVRQASEQGISSFSISYIDEDRWLVARVTNRLAASFINWNLKDRQQQATLTTQFLANELERAQESLQAQEAALQAFRSRHIGATPDQLDVNMQTISRLQSDIQANQDAISRLDGERILLSQTRRTDGGEPAPLTDRDRLIQERNRLQSELLTLHRQFTDTYPDVVNDEAQLRAVNARLAAMPEQPKEAPSYDSTTQMRLNLIDKQIQHHKELVAQLQQQIGAYQGKVQAVPVLETQLAELTRNYETSRQNYQSLLDKKLSAGMSEDLEKKQQSETFTILDSAYTPEKPFQPKRLPLMAAAALGAILLTCGSTIGFALLRGAVRSEAAVLALLPTNIRMLGTVPPIVSKADVRRGRFLTVEVAMASILVCAALVMFLLRVRPIL